MNSMNLSSCQLLRELWVACFLVSLNKSLCDIAGESNIF